MTTFQGFVVGLTLVVALAALWAVIADWLRRRRAAAATPELLPLIMRRVLLQLRDGSAIAGVLTERTGGFYVVHNAALHEAGGEVAVDGSAWVDERNVSWIQMEGEKPWP